MTMTYKSSIIGKQFNSLTVIDFVPRQGSNSYWKCRCTCGNETIVSKAHLTTGHTKTCGKCKWIGKKFGLLTVIGETGKVTNDGHKIVLCRCDCGNLCEKGTDNLSKNNLTASCGCNTMSKGEIIIKNILEEHHINFIQEYTFTDLKSDKNHLLRFDFAILKDGGSLDFLIEFDGRQHFFKSEIFKMDDQNFEYRKSLDEKKNRYCQNNHIKLIRIPYTDEKILDYDYIMRAAYEW